MAFWSEVEFWNHAIVSSRSSHSISLNPPTMSSTEITLCCWIASFEDTDPFAIDILDSQTVGQLKKSIIKDQGNNWYSKLTVGTHHPDKISTFFLIGYESKRHTAKSSLLWMAVTCLSMVHSRESGGVKLNQILLCGPRSGIQEYCWPKIDPTEMPC